LSSAAPQIPQTVRDVMSLTRLLDETYLWVDSLCIMQDDDLDKHEQLSSMGSIYANAYVTIVAAGGTAFTGLRGIKGVTEPVTSREYHRPQWWTQPGKLRARIRDHHGRLLASKWHRRAWTFQEQIFSRRLLVLDAVSAIWECHCHVWFEGVDELRGLCQDNRAVVAQGFSFDSPAKFNDYADHVTQYSRRLLTYPEDVLEAFSGILGTLTPIFEGGFICGLPVMFLDAALLWYNQLPLEKRESLDQSRQSEIAPSWSWAAWVGEVSFPDQTHGSLRSLVEWKYTSETDCPALRSASMPGLLSTKARMVVFQVDDVVDKIGLPLLTKSGECVGMLTCCVAEQCKDVRSCEVVAISEASVDGTEVYNILWIQWDRHVAYRKGVGRVVKQLWPVDEERVIDIVLG
jgi:hypothetical protein